MSAELAFALDLLWKGMAGIFVVLCVIMGLVYLLNHISSGKEEEEK